MVIMCLPSQRQLSSDDHLAASAAHVARWALAAVAAGAGGSFNFVFILADYYVLVGYTVDASVVAELVCFAFQCCSLGGSGGSS